ncbi:MAG: HemK/PrmC family methyltransferase [Spirochaetota bacterium]
MTYAELLQQIPKDISYPEALYILSFYSLQTEHKGRDDLAAREYYHQQCKTKSALLLSQLANEVPGKTQAIFLAAMEHFAKGLPIAYIIGISEFYRRCFVVGPGVLIPREDSEALLGVALRESQKYNGGKILELCCGTACISISLVLELSLNWEYWAGDISETALCYARENKDFYLAETRLHLYQSDLFSNPNLQQQYQIILANPPYLSEAEYQKRGSWKEPKLALAAGKDGMDIFRRIITQAKMFNRPGGSLLFEAAPWQMHELTKLLQANGYGQIIVSPDISGLDRVIQACYTQGS